MKDHKTTRPSEGRVTRVPNILCVAAVLFVTAGCSTVRYTSPSGEKFARTSFGGKTAVNFLSVERQTNGAAKIVLKGYGQDQVEALGVVTDAAVSAAIKSVKP